MTDRYLLVVRIASDATESTADLSVALSDSLSVSTETLEGSAGTAQSDGSVVSAVEVESVDTLGEVYEWVISRTDVSIDRIDAAPGRRVWGFDADTAASLEELGGVVLQNRSDGTVLVEAPTEAILGFKKQ